MSSLIPKEKIEQKSCWFVGVKSCAIAI